jgi:hypothetical protein
MYKLLRQVNKQLAGLQLRAAPSIATFEQIVPMDRG